MRRDFTFQTFEPHKKTTTNTHIEHCINLPIIKVYDEVGAIIISSIFFIKKVNIFSGQMMATLCITVNSSLSIGGWVLVILCQ